MTMTLTDFPFAWVPLLDAVVKATVILATAAIAASALRRGSAALRHLIWTLALASALLLPLLSMALPRWQLPIVTLTSLEPATELAQPTAASAPSLRLEMEHRATPPRLGTQEGHVQDEIAAAPARPSLSARLARISWPWAIAGLWVLGVALIIGRVIVGLIAVQWMARGGERVLDAQWMKQAIALASEVGVTTSITFLRSKRTTMPMACGVIRPAVMMPVEADGWPADRLRIVLLHELAHVKRYDCLTHLVAQFACALHWFNPLAWIAARNIRMERERACDDLVLAAGTRGPDYADQLLEIARVMRSGRCPAVLAGASLAMAHRSQLEGRLMAILDPRVPRSGLTRLRASATTMVCCAAVVPLAALQPWDRTAQPGPAVPAVSPVSAEIPQTPATSSPAPAPAPRPAPEVTGRILGEAASELADSVAGAAADGALHGAIAGALHGLPDAALDGVPGALLDLAPVPHGTDDDNDDNDDNDDQEAKPAASKADPRTVAALTAALKDSDKDVRETAMHALVQMRDPSVFDPLVQALKDVSPDVREQAAFGLGQLRDRRAVDPLIGALKDENADVREQAAFALGQLRDRTAIPALTAALKDAAADVREQAIFALGQFRDPATFEGLSIALRDANGDVREQAVFALGQLRDKRAIEPLVSALKDSVPDVRDQAAFALGQIRDRGAVEALVIALKDENADVREQAAFALGQIRDPRAIDGLTTALKDPQASVRQQAAFALGQLAR
jgi:HEAT repeat protein/beta-lactamase regulating signal transducer with metallopeptidase domain